MQAESLKEYKLDAFESKILHRLTEGGLSNTTKSAEHEQEI